MATDREGKAEVAEAFLIDWKAPDRKWVNNWAPVEEDDTFFGKGDKPNDFHYSQCGGKMSFEVKTITRLNYQRMLRKHTTRVDGDESVDNTAFGAELFIEACTDWDLYEVIRRPNGEIERDEEGKVVVRRMECNHKNRERLTLGDKWLLCSCVGGAALDSGAKQIHEQRVEQDKAEQVKN